jgi:hypothetical protein
MSKEAKQKEKLAPILQFPGQPPKEEKEEPKISFLTVFNLLARRNLVFSTITDLLSSLGGEKNQDKALTLSDLTFLCEYTLSNFTAMQTTLNRAQDTYFNIDENSLGRTVTPNDLHKPIEKTVALFYLVLKESGIPKVVYDSFSINEEEYKPKILYPACKFMADTYAHAMRATQAIGSLIDPLNISSEAEKYMKDEELTNFAKTVGSMIPTVFIENILKPEEEVTVLTDEIITKYLLKIAILSHVCNSVSIILKDIASRNQEIGVMLNLIHASTTSLSLLATEEATSDTEKSFEEAYIELISEIVNTFSILFQKKEVKEGEDKYFVQNRLVDDFYNTTRTIFNSMVEQANKSGEEASKGSDKEFKKIKLVSDSDMEEMKAETKRIIIEHLEKTKENQS